MLSAILLRGERGLDNRNERGKFCRADLVAHTFFVILALQHNLYYGVSNRKARKTVGVSEITSLVEYKSQIK